MVSEQSALEYLEKPRYHSRAQLKSQEMEQQLAELMKAMTAIQTQNTSLQSSMSSLVEINSIMVDLAGWKPSVDKAVGDLREEMGALRNQVQQLARNPVFSVKPEDLPLLLPTSAGTRREEMKVEGEPTTVGDAGARPSGHRESTSFQGKAVGEVPSPLFLPGKGAYYSQNSSPRSPDFSLVGRCWGGGYHGGSS